MTMNRKATIRAIGRRTRLKNRDVQMMLETLIEVWTEELVNGGRIEIENFFTIDVRKLERHYPTKHHLTFLKIRIRVGKRMRDRLYGKQFYS